VSHSTAKSRVLEALRGGPKTTAQLCQPDCGGVRFGARLLELREEGHTIIERRERAGSSLYTLVGVMAAPEAEAPSVAGGGLRAAGGGSHETNALPLAWRCYRCADHDAGGPVCPRGHQAEAVWLIDLRPRAAAPQVPVHDEMAEAA
jgi:hypothetical protein